MERLATTKHRWWTRRVGKYVLLCYFTELRSPLTRVPVVHETMLGKPQVKVYGMRPWCS